MKKIEYKSEEESISKYKKYNAGSTRVLIPPDRECFWKSSESIRDFNRTPRGRRQPINTVADACEFGPASIFKEHKL